MISLRELQRHLHDDGLGITARKAVMYVCRWLYDARHYRIYCADLTALPPHSGVQGPLQYRLITSDDHDLIRQIESAEKWLRQGVARRLRAGGLCLVATSRAKLAGFNLVGFGSLRISAVERTRTFRPNCAWSEQISVTPEFRGHGVASELRYRMFAELRRRGITQFYGGTMTDNVASLRLAHRVGFRGVVDIHYRRFLGIRSWRYVRLQPARRRQWGLQGEDRRDKRA